MVLSAEEWDVVALSLKVSGVAIIGSLPLAFALAWVLARMRFRGKVLLDALIHLPLVLPPVVTGWLLLLAFGANGPMGRFFAGAFGLTFMFRWSGAAVAAAIMALPLMVRAMRLSLEAVDRRLEGAARTLGAGPWRTFVSVTLPLTTPGILAALVLGLARSLGEFGATITFNGNYPGTTQTMPTLIYVTRQADQDAALSLSLVMLVVSIGVLVALRDHWLGTP